MSPRVDRVVAVIGTRIELIFTDGDRRSFDVAPYLRYPAFERLRDAGLLRRAMAARGTLAFPDGTDFCPDTVYLESVPTRTC